MCTELVQLRLPAVPPALLFFEQPGLLQEVFPATFLEVQVLP